MVLIIMQPTDEEMKVYLLLAGWESCQFILGDKTVWSYEGRDGYDGTFYFLLDAYKIATQQNHD